MSTLPTRSQQQIVNNLAAGMQGRVGTFLNFAIGSVLRAIAEAVGGVCLWLQGLALSIIKVTRLSTSEGSDVDTWLADFPLIQRLGAQPATGQVTFSRYTAAPVAVYVPVGALVQTQDGSQRFTVYADTTNPSFVSSYGAGGGYVIPASVSSVTVPVACTVAGQTGNVIAGAIRLVASSISGVDTVANAAQFANGSDSETDEDTKARFILNVLGKSGGTRYSILAAIANVRVGMQASILEGVDYGGAVDYGMTTVIIDDGSGNVSQELVMACQAGVNAVRAAGTRVGVYPATTQAANVTVQIATAAGYDHNFAVAQVVAAVSLALDELPQGQGLSYFALIPIILAVPGVTQILSYTINNSTAGITGSPYTTVKSGQLAIS